MSGRPTTASAVRILAPLVTIVVFAAVPAAAQGTPSRASIDAAITTERLVSEYRFENESSIVGDALVPHFFVQHYESTQPWLAIRARYRAGRRAAQTTVGYAPERLAFGSDIDTFFQPDGDVVTSGTAGDVRLQAFSIDQRLGLAAARRWSTGVDARYTRRRADFLPADRVVTHSRPASETRERITTRELTTSHEIRIGLTAGAFHDLAHGWRVEAGGVAWPVVRGRLVTELPDKYPGEDIVFDAVGFGGEARVAFVRRIATATLALTVHAGGLMPYRDSASLRQRTLGAGISVGLGGGN